MQVEFISPTASSSAFLQAFPSSSNNSIVRAAHTALGEQEVNAKENLDRNAISSLKEQPHYRRILIIAAIITVVVSIPLGFYIASLPGIWTTVGSATSGQAMVTVLFTSTVALSIIYVLNKIISAIATKIRDRRIQVIRQREDTAMSELAHPLRESEIKSDSESELEIDETETEEYDHASLMTSFQSFLKLRAELDSSLGEEFQQELENSSEEPEEKLKQDKMDPSLVIQKGVEDDFEENITEDNFIIKFAQFLKYSEKNRISEFKKEEELDRFLILLQNKNKSLWKEIEDDVEEELDSVAYAKPLSPVQAGSNLQPKDIIKLDQNIQKYAICILLCSTLRFLKDSCFQKQEKEAKLAKEVEKAKQAQEAKKNFATKIEIMELAIIQAQEEGVFIPIHSPEMLSVYNYLFRLSYGKIGSPEQPELRRFPFLMGEQEIRKA